MEEREFDFKDSKGYWFSGWVYIDESRPGNHKYVIEYDWIDDPKKWNVESFGSCRCNY